MNGSKQYQATRAYYKKEIEVTHNKNHRTTSTQQTIKLTPCLVIKWMKVRVEKAYSEQRGGIA